MHMQVLYRILKGDDMCVAVFVDPVDDGCKGCRLTGSGRSCYEDKSSLSLMEIDNCLGNTELLRIGNFGTYKSECKSGRTSLLEDVNTVTAESGNRE